MKKDRKLRIICMCAFLLIFALLNAPGDSDATDNPDEETIIGEGWSITGQRGARESLFDRCEGTDDLIYFCYTDEDYIDAYDLSGEYQFTIHLPDAQNGGLYIDCVGDLLIADAANNDVYVFRGRELVEAMDNDTARAKGYAHTFYDNGSRYGITRTHVVRLDGEEMTELFPLPPEIEENLPFVTLTTEQTKVFNRVLLIVFAAAWLGIVGTGVSKIWKGFREDRKKKYG